MQDQNGARRDEIGLERLNSFLKSSSIFYVIMASVGAMVMILRLESFGSAFGVPSDLKAALTLPALGLMATGVLLIVNYLFEEQFSSYRAFKHVMMQMVGAASVPMALYLAFISALGEEILFRGTIQPYLGLLGTSLLFGLLHLGPQGLISMWTVWAVISGLLLGWMYQDTGSLWPSLICHFLLNTISLLRLRIQYQEFQVARSDSKAKLVARR